MITIVSIKDPLKTQENVKDLYEYSPNKTLGEYLSKSNIYRNDQNFVICVNGSLQDSDETVINDEDIISVCAKTEISSAVAGFVAGSLFSTAFSTAVAYTLTYAAVYAATTFAVGYGLNALASALGPDVPKDKVSNAADSGQKTYGWSDPQQSFNEGVPIKYIFGSNLVSGQVLSFFTKIADNDEQLNTLLGICDHEIDSITDIKLNGRDYTDFSNVEVTTRLGTLTDTVIEGFSDIVTTTSVNSKLEYTGVAEDDYIEIETQGNQVESITVVITYPKGIYYINPTTGVYGPTTATHTIEVLGPTGDDTVYESTTANITTYNPNVVRKSYDIGPLTPMQYRVRVTRTVLIRDTALSHSESYFTLVQEIVKDENLTYPGLAKYAIQIVATDQLSGSIPNITCVATKSTIDIWDEELATPDYAAKRATNPAWIVWYLLQHYAGIDKSRIIWDEFNTWANYCDELITVDSGTSTGVAEDELTDSSQSWSTDQWIGYTLIDSVDAEFIITGNTDDTLSYTGTATGGAYTINEYRFEANVVVDDGNFWDKIQEIARIGRASIIRRGTRYGVFVDYEDSVVSHLFSMGNIIDGSLKLSYLPQTDMANSVEVEYSDVNRDHTKQVVTLFTDNYLSSTDSVKKATVSINASIPQTQAVREGIFRINGNMYLKRVITFNAFIDSFSCTVGDIFYFQHLTPNYTDKIGGRIVDAGNDNGSGQPYIKFDRQLTVGVGESYAFVVRLSDNTLVEKFITTAPTTSDTFVITSSWATVPDGKEPYFLGLSASYKKKYRLTSVSRNDDFTRTLTGIEYIEDIYTNNDGFVIDELTNTTEVTKANNVLLEEILVFDRGDFRSNLNVSWSKTWVDSPNRYTLPVITWAIWLEDLTTGTDPILIGQTRDFRYTILNNYIQEGFQYMVYVNVAETNEGAIQYAS